MQGFRKVDSDRWEFANEAFLRGERHLLKSIQRRRPVSTLQPSLPASGLFLEVGKYDSVLCEIESLEKDKNMLVLEVGRLRERQQCTEQTISILLKCLESSEQTQQQMMSLLGRTLQNPSFMGHLRQKNEQAKCLESTRKRRFLSEGSSSVQSVSASLSERLEDGQFPDGNEFLTGVNEELNAMLQGMEQDRLICKRVGETILTQNDNVYTNGKGKAIAWSSFEDQSRTSFLGTHGNSNVASWEESLHMPNQVVFTCAKKDVHNEALGDHKAAKAFGEGIENCSNWEFKPDINLITKQMHHLESSTPQGI